MANRIKVAKEFAILQLWRQGHSYRRIARMLDVHRDTVAVCVEREKERAKPANPTLGSEGPDSPQRGDPALGAELPRDSKPAKATRGSSTVPSQCEPFREVVLAKLEQGLSGQRIWQDLAAEHGLRASYSSVKRFVRRLGPLSPLPFRRMECAPGEEAQADFGTGAPIVGSEGRRRRSHVFRIVLSHSRKGYSEAVFRQTTETFLRVLENAFRAFGGVPRVVLIDQLRAAVAHPDWFDPELAPKVADFCRHYGVAIVPTRPYTPRHKGKAERGIDYVKENGLKGHTFPGLAEENRHLTDWECRVADLRLHGTTRQQVREVFETVERPALRPLPPDLFPAFHEAQRRVHADGHVEVERAYYSVPPEYVGHTVWVRWDGRLVRIFTRRLQPITVHAQTEAGRFATAPAHLASEKISSVERGATWLLARAARIGPAAGRWAEAMLEARGIEGLRVLQGLLALARKQPADALEKACESALSHQIFRLRALRALVREPTTQATFLEEHPLIRPLADYGRFVRVAFSPEAGEERKEEDAFIAFDADGRDRKRESPDCSRAFPAARRPAAALGSLASGALSSRPACETLADRETLIQPKGDLRS